VATAPTASRFAPGESGRSRSGVLSYDSDGTGAADAVQIAVLAKSPGLTARDVVVWETR
jgi:hypothetical protein